MPKYRVFQGWIILIFLILIGLDFQFQISNWWYVLLIIIILGIVTYGSSQINSQFFIKTICSGDKKKKKIALTFDDGPHPEITPKILETLEKNEVKATFFVIGKNISDNEPLIKKMDLEGHIIGNHSFSHSYFFDFFSTQKVCSELIKTQSLISKLINKRPRFFRPPFGVTNPQIAKASQRLKLDVIGWNIRSLDTVYAQFESTNLSAKRCFNRVVRKLDSGNLILFHETNLMTVKVLEDLLEYLKKENYEVVSLNELIDKEAYF